MPAMMAASNNPPFNRDDPASGLYRHDTYVSFYLEIPSPSVANPPPPPPPATTAPAVVAPPPTTAAAVAPAVTTTVVGTTTATATTSKAAATTIINIPTFVHSNGSSTYCYDTKLTFCVATIKDASTITFTMYSTVKGWISIGTGSFMDGSTMFVAWKDGSDVLITQRIGKGHDQPPLAPKPIFTKVATPASVTIPAAFSGLIASFQIPASSNLVSASGPTNFIFATSNDPVAKPSDVNSMYPQHSVSGAFTLDVSKGGVGTTAEKSGVDLILLHGIAMFIAWAVVPPVAIFIARYLKKALGHKWYLSHVGLFLFGTGGLIVMGLVTVEVNLAPGVTRFIGSSVHGIMGTVIALALYPLQCVLGFASNYFFDENRKKVAVIDQVHWWVGRTIVCWRL
ncbi:hypothetical protein BCR33DRAFT_370892 [Rhizoclosmatium globosum]|uniref:Cellobiose dehydrogenase-like cytochrome domain-containing protein n=1 Tax=Rhizoclosmatium globosum TaxID=329046 RepID=A0A1Y2BZP9_9FUNG|nr:hypothetical protein BCR33DRAFT_370892 [Rhizoclosmatium globosum]|eukprot:ORY40144.1 hypothetical protein BCR33DRAFT_370892 [Rhizoclosmatium globosum]